MSNRLDYEIKSLKKEVLALKSWGQKVAGQLRTKEYLATIEFTLDYDINQKLAATKTAVITVTPQDISRTMLASYGMDIEDLDKRSIWTIGGLNDTNGYVYKFYINHTDNPNDGVGTKITYNVAITTTALADIVVTYED